MKYYNESVDDVLKSVDSTSEGLSDKSVKLLLDENGLNKLDEKKKKNLFLRFIEQFNDKLILILFAAAIITLILAYFEGESYTDSIIIMAIVFLNAILGFSQEMKSDKAIADLAKLQTTKVKVRRNNKVILVNSEEIVIGDIILIEAGDKVVADCRIISSVSLKVEEASLTGESFPVEKDVKKISGEKAISERINMIYAGTSVVYGKGEAVVVKTGMNTEIGKIATSLNDTVVELTPLQKKINEISKVISIVIFIIIIIMFIVGLMQGMNLSHTIMLSVALAVAAIPEGLPAVITVTLSLGMVTMAKKKAIVRKMSSVETLGSTEIICSDKTGTITQNKMTIREVYFDGDYLVEKVENELIRAMSLNNDVVKDGNNYIGDPTEVALFTYCEDLFDVGEYKNKYNRIGELPFDSDRKMMSVINKVDKDVFMYTKGSLDSLIERCSHVLKNGKLSKISKKSKDELFLVENELADKAYRVLGFAYKKVDSSKKFNLEDENDLIFVGMVAMIDPPRVDVIESIKLCKSAHIRPIMITGDSLPTAVAIAKEIGILENEDEAILGLELDKYSDKEMIDVVKKYNVYARVSPMNKVSIVKAWKKNNKVVAMTGDGVNDAPSIKSADIGIGMGITGTEVSKGVSDIVLADDSFSTIVTAVKEGRRIFDNIRNVLVYLLAANIAEVLVVFIGMLFGVEIFLPIQLLYVNLVTDSIPAIALAFEKASGDIMNRDIRKRDSSFFTPLLSAKIVSGAVLKAIIILLVYYIGYIKHSPEVGSTMAFVTLILLEMAFSYTSRNLKTIMFGKELFSNSVLNKSILGLIVLQILLFVTPMKELFNVVDMNLNFYLLSGSLVMLVFIINELLKPIIVKYFKD